MRAAERGEGLIDAVIAAAIASIVLAGVTAAVVTSTRWLGSSERASVLSGVAHREARVAADLLKYQGAALAPQTIATSAPLPGASPLPIHLTLSTAANADGTVTITISATDDSTSLTSTVSTRTAKPVPLPQSYVNASAPGSQPL